MNNICKAVLDQVLESRQYQGLKKAALLKSKGKILPAAQHQQQAISLLGKSLEQSEKSLKVLDCPEPNSPNQPGWQLAWSDEFNTPGKTPPDPANWEHMLGDGSWYGIWRWGNMELQWYTDDISNSWVENGYLTIQAKEQFMQGYNYTSARLRTKDRHDFLYGRMEASIKVPHGGGMWPAFWMMPTDNVYGGWAVSGEIDIMETRNQTDFVGGAIHFGGPSPNNTFRSDYYYGNGYTDFSQDFHIYALEWEPDQMRWYVDGVHYLTYTSADWYSLTDPGNPRAPFDQQFHILLNVAVGGSYTGCQEPVCITANFPQQMLIDYVRVYHWQE